MPINIITPYQIEKRRYWIDRISQLSGNFGIDATKIETEIAQETNLNGIDSLLGHLRLCGVIPENYSHDSSEEKLYSKYTDIVIHETFLALGMNSIVLKERADVADVECIADNFSFVADAKVFRLSRTAKNQKDFKIQAMHGWKRGKPFAMVVCPVYQLPTKTSQIYHQAATQSVCILTYTHLAVLVRYATQVTPTKSTQLLHEIFKSVQAMLPSKEATSYWQVLNRTILNFDNLLSAIWQDEKIASAESIQVAKDEAMYFLAQERERIMKLSKEEAIREILKSSKLESKLKIIRAITDNGLLEIG